MKLSSRRRYHVEDGEPRINITRQYVVSITPTELEQQYLRQWGRCYILGSALDPWSVFEPHNPFAMSADRLDTEQDYVPGNVVLVNRFLNVGRGRAPLESFKQRLLTLTFR